MAKYMQYGVPKINPRSPGMDAIRNIGTMKTKNKPKKMTKEQVANRKKKMISNTASKVMGGLYSK